MKKEGRKKREKRKKKRKREMRGSRQDISPKRGRRERR